MRSSACAEVLEPLVEEGQALLRSHASRFVSRLPPRVGASLERSLRRVLNETCDLVLGASVRRFVAERDPLAEAQGDVPFPLPGPHDRAFADAFRRMGGWTATFRTYPTLQRLLRIRRDDWVEATAEALERADADRAALGESFDDGRDPGPPVAAEPRCSDPHDGGRTVWALRFTSGLEVFYKPRDLGADAALGGVLDTLASPDGPLLPGAPAVLGRGGHGWTLRCRPDPCADEAAVQRFYRRAGALLALAHFLGAGDLHCENIVASGEHPVVVDAETLVGGGVFSLATRPRTWSVLDTGLLHDPGNECALGFDPSGLGEGLVPDRGGGWRGTVADARAGSNVPRLAGRAVPARACVGEIVDGFTDMWRHLKRTEEALLAVGSPLRSLLRQPRRLFLRPSEAYALMLRRLTRPVYLRNPSTRSAAIDRFLESGPTLDLPADIRSPILAAERDALSHSDIPRFVFHPREATLRTGAGVVLEGLRDGYSVDWLRARLRTFSRRDLRVAVQQIRRSLAEGPHSSRP